MPGMYSTPDEGGNSQADLAATTLTDVFTGTAYEPVALKAVVFCNRTGGALTVRLSYAPGGDADANAQYLLYDKSIAANDYLLFSPSMPILLGKGDVLRAYASNTGISVNIFADPNV